MLGPVCVCGRSFSQLSAFSNHRRLCQKSKKRLSNVLDKAKRQWSSNKRRRLGFDDPSVNQPSTSGLVREGSPSPQDVSQTTTEDDGELAGVMEDSNLTMMERRPWARRLNRRLPLRFRDVLPQPPPALPPQDVVQAIESPSVEPPEGSSPSLAMRIRSRMRRIRIPIRV